MSGSILTSGKSGNALRILFVCTGNTCRSCMAEAIMKHVVKNDPELADMITVTSAGISAYNGDPASENASRVLHENWGIDVSMHRANRLQAKDIEAADLILAMTQNHKEYLTTMFPGARRKIYTLKQFSIKKKHPDEVSFRVDSPDITDPFGRSLKTYKECAEEIKNAILKLIEMLKNGEQ